MNVQGLVASGSRGFEWFVRMCTMKHPVPEVSGLKTEKRLDGGKASLMNHQTRRVRRSREEGSTQFQNFGEVAFSGAREVLAW